MIEVLTNPRTEEYTQLKRSILSETFPWYWHLSSTPGEPVDDTTVDAPFFCHSFLMRPELSAGGSLFPKPSSTLTDFVSQVLYQILSFNNVEIKSFLRIATNQLPPDSPNVKTHLHHDHSFPHKNLLVYLNDTDGDTLVEGEACSPEEDKVVVFSGIHQVVLPTRSRRVVIVATFI